VPLPPPRVITIDTMTDKTKTIAALQAQIASRLSKLTTQVRDWLTVSFLAKHFSCVFYQRCQITNQMKYQQNFF
jgi:hypothetical protein